MLKHVLCVYPYRRELNEVGFFPFPAATAEYRLIVEWEKRLRSTRLR